MIMDRPFMPKYGTVPQVLLQLVVAHAQSRTRHFLRDYIYIFLLHDFSINTERKFTNTVKDNVKLRRSKTIFFERKEFAKNDLRAIERADYRLTSFPWYL